MTVDCSLHVYKAALLFKPTNIGKKSTQPKSKPKANFSSMHSLSSSTSTIGVPPAAAISPDFPPPSSTSQAPATYTHPTPTQKRGFNDWVANEDDELYYDRPRVNSNKRRKNKKKQQLQQVQTWSWDDIYDPTLPVKFQQYPKSDAQYDINEGWKRRLYDAHKQEKRRGSKGEKRASSEEEDGYSE